MRLKRNRLNTYFHCAAIPKKDGEGGSYIEYGSRTPFEAEQWAAGGKTQTGMYGIRLPNIRNLRIQGTYEEIRTPEGKVAYKVSGGPLVTAGDGICLCGSDPDYKVIAIYPYRFLTLEVERL